MINPSEDKGFYVSGTCMCPAFFDSNQDKIKLNQVKSYLLELNQTDSIHFKVLVLWGELN